MTASLFPTDAVNRRPSMSQSSRKPMRKSGDSLRRLGVIDPQVFAERVAAFLREIYPDKTANHVEAATGVPAKTVSKWLDLTSAPNGANYQRLIEVYSVEIVFYVSPGASDATLREAARICRQARLERAAAAALQRAESLWSGL